MSKNEIQLFLHDLWEFYSKNNRELAWREPFTDGTYSPYRILLSEIMLQQTQVSRVAPKYRQFLTQFPSIERLASASLADVIVIWSGLGYNRRAKYIHDFAKNTTEKSFPRTVEGLTAHKGIGVNTAAAVLVYAYGERHLFVETNIRTVTAHHFYVNKLDISDGQILKTLDSILHYVEDHKIRDFYWAMMDYGSYLKKQGIRNNSLSSGYKKQSKFEGSLRQLRGEVLRKAQQHVDITKLQNELKDDRLNNVITTLQREGLLRISDGKIIL